MQDAPQRDVGWKPVNPPVTHQVLWWYDESGQTLAVFLNHLFTGKEFKPRLLVFDAVETAEILRIPGSRFDGDLQRKIMQMKATFGGSFLGEWMSREERLARGPEPEPSGLHPFQPPSNEPSESSNTPSGKSAPSASESPCGETSDSAPLSTIGRPLSVSWEDLFPASKEED